MKRFRKRDISLALAILLLTIAAAPKPATAVLAQVAFPVPASVPQGTNVRIDGSTSLTAINQMLGDRFKAKFPNTQVNISYDGSDAALQSVLDGKVDLAAIGSPLTPEQKAKGLVEVPVARHKIAIIVGVNNPFAASLTGEQFASMFRGELTDWSQVGGSPAPIRVIDRPDTSDTRRAFARYPVFQAAPFQAGATTSQLDADSTDAVIQQLGNDGISYAIADQVVNNPAVRVLPMYGTLPSDPAYPFSQPLSYVYNGASGKPSAAVQAFLGFATAPDNQPNLEAARVATATGAVQPAPQASTGVASAIPSASPNAEGSPNADNAEGIAASPATTASPGSAVLTGEVPPGTVPENSPTGAIAPGDNSSAGGLFSRWWWLLPVLGSLGVLAWLLREQAKPDIPLETAARMNAGARAAGSSSDMTGAAGAAAIETAGAAAIGTAAAAAVGTAAAPHDSRIILTPRTCREAYAYWEVDAAHKTLLKQQGGNQLALRLYDATDIDLYYQAPHSLHEFTCDEEARDLHVPIPTDDRDYVAELGYTTADHRWLPLARSPHVRVPACTAAEPPRGLSNGAATSPTATSPVATSPVTPNPAVTSDRAVNRLILVPRSAEDLYAYWELPEGLPQGAQQGKQQLILRVYDITGVDLSSQPPRSVQQFECNPEANDRHVSVPAYGDYIATLGYMTPEKRWVSLARSTPVRIREAGRSSGTLLDRS
jgi:phosphate transport system substrate-binding protein